MGSVEKRVGFGKHGEIARVARVCSANPSNSLVCARELRISPATTAHRINGGEGEIRTHVPELPDHPISSRRRYDRFGTSPREKLGTGN